MTSGAWTHPPVTDRLPDDELDASSRRSTVAIADEAERQQDWLGDVRVKWRHPTPLQRSLELG